MANLLAFQKGLEKGWKSGKNQWKVREFWNGYWVATLGPGGTGKSHVINLLRELITRCSLQSLSSDSTAVVVTAPTGVAAFNIDGVTIRCALNLPVQHGNNPNYQSSLILTELFQHNQINVSYLTACYLYQVMMTLHFLNDVANDTESTQKKKPS